MTTAEMFKGFTENLAVDNAAQISLRYGEITAGLNKRFRDTESKTANCLQVGSYGRWTAIKGVSDLDMLYIMPGGKWDDYKGESNLTFWQIPKTQLVEDTRQPRSSSTALSFVYYMETFTSKCSQFLN